MKNIIFILKADNGGYIIQLQPLMVPTVPIAVEYAKDVDGLLAVVERMSEKLFVNQG